MNLHAAILEKYGELTVTNKKIADFVLANKDFIPFKTLDVVASYIGVSTASVIRFTRVFGYSGYSTFQMELREALKDNSSMTRRLELSLENMNKSQLLADSFDNEIINLAKTLELLSVEKLDEAVSEIINAKNVYIVGMQACFSPAYYLAARLSQVKANVRLLQGVGNIYQSEATSVGVEDVCIAYLLPRYSRSAISLVDFIKKAGSKVIVICGPNYKAIEMYGDIFLPCWIHGVSMKNSLVAPICLSQYLVSAIMNSDTENAKLQMSRTEQFLAQSGCFIIN